jgi:hypothetical protein
MEGERMAAQEFDTQFQDMKAALAERGVNIEVAYAASGEPDYLYETGRLLVGVPPAQNSAPVTRRVLRALPGARLADVQPGTPSLQVISIDHLNGEQLSVPQALDRLNREKIGLPAGEDDFPTVTPVHIMHVAGGGGVQPDNARICGATEPELPTCPPDQPCDPWPPVAPCGGAGAVIGVADTGLLAGPPAAPWLNGVLAGPADVDPLGALVSPGGNGNPARYAIPVYCGHGTFAAGVARTQAPEAEVQVSRDFRDGGEREWEIADKVRDLLARHSPPQVINVSAGTNTRHDWRLLSFLSLYAQDPKGQSHAPSVVLVAAAGNDISDRPFWPAAFDWAVGVGALGPDLVHRAWFSNYGPWVDVYAPGEDVVNAFATGEYTYVWPPRQSAVQDFAGRARWSGTSFSAPLVAGLIAATMTRHNLTAAAARDGLLGGARAANPAFPVLLPWPAVNNVIV